MPLLESHHRILSCAESERVPKIWHFVWNLRLVLCRNNAVLTMRGLYMLPKAPIIIVIQLRKIMNQSSSNGCLSLQHNTPFPTLRGYLKSDIFMKFESVFVLQKWHCVDYKGFVDAIQAPTITVINLMKIMKQSSSNGCLPLQQSITFQVLRGFPKSDIFHEIWD